MGNRQGQEPNSTPQITDSSFDDITDAVKYIHELEQEHSLQLESSETMIAAFVNRLATSKKEFQEIEVIGQEKIAKSIEVNRQRKEERLELITISKDADSKSRFEGKAQELRGKIKEFEEIIFPERMEFLREDLRSKALRQMDHAWEERSRQLTDAHFVEVERAIAISTEEHTKAYNRHIGPYVEKIQDIKQQLREKKKRRGGVIDWLINVASPKKTKPEPTDNSDADSDSSDAEN